MLSKESPESSSTSSYSSAEGTPISSPLNKPLNESKEQNKDKSVVNQLNASNRSDGMNRRSSSDGAIMALEESLVASNVSMNDSKRSDCVCDDLIRSTKNRMTEKFNKLEEESGLKLRSNTTKCGQNEEIEAKDQLEDSWECCQKRVKCPSIAEVKEQANHRLNCELIRAQNELKLRDEEVAKLSRIREEVESELEDLTASLFEEANHMVYKANVLRSRAQKELYEADLKIEVLQAEVQALKLLVLTSTPSNHSSNRVNGVKSLLNKSKANSLTKRSPSNYELGGSASDRLDSMSQNDIESIAQTFSGVEPNQAIAEDIGEVDPYFHEEFLEWKKCPNFEPMNSSFIKRIYDEEIYPVFNFKDKDLTAQVLRAIEDNTIIIEVVSDKSPFPKRCALLDAPRSCKYRMKIDDKWHNISQLCRNRIIAVCDLFCYLRYIERGLVKSSYHDVYWEVLRRRRNIALSRLGFSAF